MKSCVAMHKTVAKQRVRPWVRSPVLQKRTNLNIFILDREFYKCGVPGMGSCDTGKGYWVEELARGSTALSSWGHQTTMSTYQHILITSKQHFCEPCTLALWIPSLRILHKFSPNLNDQCCPAAGTQVALSLWSSPPRLPHDQLWE